MTNNNRTSQEIEREIEDQRSNLSATLEGLQDKLSIDAVLRQVGDQFREHGGDIGRTITEQVKANPVPVALTGLGLAWLVFGGAKGSTKSHTTTRDGYGTSEHEFRRSQMDRGRSFLAPSYSTSRSYEDPSWSVDDDPDGGGSDLSDGTGALKGAVERGAASLAGKASQAATSVQDRAQAAATAASDTAASARSKVSDMADNAKENLGAVGSRIAEGTESLSEEGRQRVINARRKAVEIRRRAASSARDGSDVVSDFYDRQPLVIGALALAVGAALGGALPRTKTEDNLLGEHSDNLFDEAEQIFQDEKSKALSVAQSVKDEIKDIASETKSDLDSGAPGDKSAVEAVGDKAQSMVGRVANKAKSTAKEQKLGKPKA